MLLEALSTLLLLLVTDTTSGLGLGLGSAWEAQNLKKTALDAHDWLWTCESREKHVADTDRSGALYNDSSRGCLGCFSTSLAHI